jgi:hypothetical protein
MSALLFAGLPGAAFFATLSCALAWMVMTWAHGFFVAAGVGIASLLLWLFWLPRRAEGKLFRTWLPRPDASLTRSWERAFDGIDPKPLRPRLLLISNPIPQFLVLDLPGSGRSVWVSEGWLVARGESGFRSACRAAAARLSDPRLKMQTRAALLATWLSGKLGGVSHALLSPGSEASRRRRASAWAVALGTLGFLWLGWLVRLTGERSDTQVFAPHSAPAAWSVDWAGRLEPEGAAIEQYLSIEREWARVAAKKSILSWLPAHW